MDGRLPMESSEKGGKLADERGESGGPPGGAHQPERTLVGGRLELQGGAAAAPVLAGGVKGATAGGSQVLEEGEVRVESGKAVADCVWDKRRDWVGDTSVGGEETGNDP